MNAPAPQRSGQPGTVAPLSSRQALDLLAGASFGRIVFTQDALPAVRPVNHLLDDGRIIVRTRLSSGLGTATRSSRGADVVVAYEADKLDERRRCGWSVVVTGLATVLSDPDLIARYETLLQPWANLPMGTVLAITPQIITGIRINTVAVP